MFITNVLTQHALSRPNELQSFLRTVSGRTVSFIIMRKK